MLGKKEINKYYQLKEENYEEFQELAQCPNYETILKCLIEGRVRMDKSFSSKPKDYPTWENNGTIS